MTEDLGHRLRRAADDGDRPLPVRPTELLAQARRDRRRHRVFAGATGTALAVGAVAAVLAATAVLPSSDDRSDDRPDPAEQGRGKVVPLDHGPLPEGNRRDYMLSLCSSDSRGQPRSEDAIESARLLNGPLGLTPVMLVSADRSLQAVECAELAWAAVRGDRLPTPTVDEPIRAVPVYGRGAVARMVRTGYWITGGVYAVADTVDRVEVRVSGDGTGEPWRAATAHDGYVFWATWFNPDSYAKGERLRVQWRAFDSDGNQLDPALLPERSRVISAPGPMLPDYEQARDLLFDVASEYLDPDGEHLSVNQGRDGKGSGSRWSSVEPAFEWRTEGDPGVGSVRVELANTADDLVNISRSICAGNGSPDCERRDLGEDGNAWVLDYGDGLYKVVHEQADGEAVAVTVDPQFDRLDAAPVRDIDVALEDVLDLVTDDRLDLPGPPQ